MSNQHPRRDCQQQHHHTVPTPTSAQHSGKYSRLPVAIIAVMLTLLLISGCSSTATTNQSSATDSSTATITESPTTSDEVASPDKTVTKDQSNSATAPTDKDATPVTDSQASTGAKEADQQTMNDTQKTADPKENTTDSASTKTDTNKDQSSTSTSTPSTSNTKEKSSSTSSDSDTPSSQKSTATSDNQSKSSTKDTSTKSTKDNTKTTTKDSKPSTSTSKPSSNTAKGSGTTATPTTPSAPKPQPQASTVTLSITGDSNILGSTSVPVEAGESALDLLKRVTRSKGIPMEYQGSSGFAYVEGIDNLYEFDEGPTSGWMFKVNGNFPNMSAGAYKVQAGDQIDWLYTTDLGKDVGAKN
ncbi:outer membrane murein-binding lipoprotein Lpp [Paenibacillus sp. SORGH_AS306]|uniref:DUF4430 domain-containing protein n=1 Tax=unclassified Paenibacillus TaxID=185978 RepID=UPI0027883E5F|nr:MULTISPECIES: DUF4430 domain-containing protein [unclassified Paenibacillus]MDQ1236302.1 outer membrane murein-binding lipoprotein Lpp [Paenibacillus sp. SORGH_AS_0306]MDR6108656.1 outer membrane murein-binding lipoprotein Lpp [Paenibacillus sp. SORGH_AS_0338]